MRSTAFFTTANPIPVPSCPVLNRWNIPKILPWKTGGIPTPLFWGTRRGSNAVGSAKAKAERIIQEKLTRLGWDATQMQLQRKNDPRRLAIAARLRRETTLSLKAIAARLGLGSSKSANATLHRWMAQQNPGAFAEHLVGEIDAWLLSRIPGSSWILS
jgi:predicted transcriptional regulator